MICFLMFKKLLSSRKIRSKKAGLNEERRGDYRKKDYIGRERRGHEEAFFINPYKILNIHRRATYGETKKARNRLLSKFHPDVAGHDKELERTKLINWAYATIKRKLKQEVA